VRRNRWKCIGETRLASRRPHLDPVLHHRRLWLPLASSPASAPALLSHARALGRSSTPETMWISRTAARHARLPTPPPPPNGRGRHGRVARGDAVARPQSSRAAAGWSSLARPPLYTPSSRYGGLPACHCTKLRAPQIFSCLDNCLRRCAALIFPSLFSLLLSSCRSTAPVASACALPRKQGKLLLSTVQASTRNRGVRGGVLAMGDGRGHIHHRGVCEAEASS
jgi:hypothetical protein